MVKKNINKNTASTSGIGIFGGTFDPIHVGHSQSAGAVAQWLNLAKILFIPAHIPPHKNCVNSVPTASAKQRSAMVELVCKEHNLFECDNRELMRQQHSYTIDTLLELKEKYPQQSLFFIIGMDSLLTFTRWHRFQDILKLCHLVVNTRPNYDLSQVNSETETLLAQHRVLSKDELTKESVGAIFFTKPLFIDVSSTKLRQNLKTAQCCQQYLYPSVIDFINKNQLYR